jgi:hypothetical protein
VRRHFVSLGFRFVAFHHFFGELAQARGEAFWVQQLRWHRIDAINVFGVLAEGAYQFVVLAVTGPVADKRGPLEALLARLPPK